MKNKHLTASDRQTIRELLHSGKNYVQIAEILKKSPTTISREIEKHKKCYRKELPLTHYPKRSCCWLSTISTATPEDEVFLVCN